jgi:phospholipid transport system substrate-binding protein
VLRRYSLRVSLAILACTLVARGEAAARGATGATPDPWDELRRTDSALEAVLRRRVPDWSPEADAVRGRVDSILAGTLDYEEIARRALDGEWSKLTSAEQREFLQTFATLTNHAFVSAVTRPDVHFRLDSEMVNGPIATVRVTAWLSKPSPETEQQLEYRFTRKRDRWLVYDVLVDQVSLVDAYRDQFARLIRRGGFVELMGRMQHKLEASGRY